MQEKVLFWYDLTSLKASNKVRFVYTIKGKKAEKGLVEKFGGGPVGLNTISAAISEEQSTLEDIYEPFLIKMGFLERTSRGRIVTKRAYEHLGIVKKDL